jgi:hypothetical protein
VDVCKAADTTGIMSGGVGVLFGSAERCWDVTHNT